MDDVELDIGEVAHRTGLATSALRFYERKRLIEPTGRVGLRRQYAPEIIDRLAIILAATEAGFRLDEIGDLIDARHTDQDVRARLARKISEIEQRIVLLAGVRDRLRHAVTCSAPRLIECPHFLDGVRSVLPRTATRKRLIESKVRVARQEAPQLGREILGLSWATDPDERSASP